MVNHISERTGLDPSTVLDLLERGWTFQEGHFAYPVWIAPGHPTKFNTAEENSAE